MLVRRHGSLVWATYRRLLPSAHDAEDAFQATFLELLRKAASIRKQASVACWLYSVARRVAFRALPEKKLDAPGRSCSLIGEKLVIFPEGSAHGYRGARCRHPSHP
jgi:RNA polymerase sigma factor (sigma-70 family)